MAVHVNGLRVRPGRRLDTAYEGAGLYVYPLDTPDPEPDFVNPATPEAIDELPALLGKWNYEIGAAGARLVLAWIA